MFLNVSEFSLLHTQRL